MDYPLYPDTPEHCPKCHQSGLVYIDICAGQVTVKCLRWHHVVRHGYTKGAAWVDRKEDEWAARRGE